MVSCCLRADAVIKGCNSGFRPSPHALPTQWCLASKVAQASSKDTLRCSATRPQPLQAISTKFTSVLSWSLTSEAQASAPGPWAVDMHPGGHLSGWGVHSHGTVCTGLHLFQQLPTDGCALLRGSEAPLYPGRSLLMKGLRGVGTFPLSQLPSKSTGPIWIPSPPPFFLSSYPVMWRFSRSFRGLRSSARAQWMSGENHPTCGYILMYSWKGLSFPSGYFTILIADPRGNCVLSGDAR